MQYGTRDANTRNLKLVGAQSYVGPRTDNQLLQKGDQYHFTQEHASAALSEVQMDALNNSHPLFKEVVAETKSDEPVARVSRTRASTEDGGTKTAKKSGKK